MYPLKKRYGLSEVGNLASGSLDSANQSKIMGWAYDARYGGTVPVNIYIGKPGFAPNADTWKGSVVATAPRPDLVPAGVAPDPNHGFVFDTPNLSPGTYEAKAFLAVSQDPYWLTPARTFTVEATIPASGNRLLDLPANVLVNRTAWLAAPPPGTYGGVDVAYAPALEVMRSVVRAPTPSEQDDLKYIDRFDYLSVVIPLFPVPLASTPMPTLTMQQSKQPLAGLGGLAGEQHPVDMGTGFIGLGRGRGGFKSGWVLPLREDLPWKEYKKELVKRSIIEQAFTTYPWPFPEAEQAWLEQNFRFVITPSVIGQAAQFTSVDDIKTVITVAMIAHWDVIIDRVQGLIGERAKKMAREEQIQMIMVGAAVLAVAALAALAGASATVLGAMKGIAGKATAAQQQSAAESIQAIQDSANNYNPAFAAEIDRTKKALGLDKVPSGSASSTPILSTISGIPIWVRITIGGIGLVSLAAYLILRK